jgi:hypothetical protein
MKATTVEIREMSEVLRELGNLIIGIIKEKRVIQ